MNPLRSLQDYGQAVWLVFVTPCLITEGDLKKLIDEGSLRSIAWTRVSGRRRFRA
jgi:hypothetical protein